jgi:hypothetical protein
MKKHYSLVKTLFFIVSALLVFQIIILSMKVDLRRIITTAIVVIGFIATFIITLILRKEASKIIYEYEDEDGNNEKPYCFREFGPGSFFGQEVDAWCELPTDEVLAILNEE